MIVDAAGRIDQGAGTAFGEPTRYLVEIKGRTYAPKALIGVASGIAFGQELKPSDFSSGLARGQAVYYLRKLGFIVREIDDAKLGRDESPFHSLVVGQKYSRPELRQLAGL